MICRFLLFRVAVVCLLSVTVLGINGGTPRISTSNGWKVIEVVSEGQGLNGYQMPSNFDGTGAFALNDSTLRIIVNHEEIDASISQVDLDVAKTQSAISNMIKSGNTGGERFVVATDLAYRRWTSDGGLIWDNRVTTADTNFFRFCSGQSYIPDTFGRDRGFVDDLYILGEEGPRSNRLFVLDLARRDFYQLSGVTGSAPGGNGGMDFDSWENAALIDTGETNYVALVLSPDVGSMRLKLYIGEKGKDFNGNDSSSFLARNGLAYGSWYYFIGTLPTGSSSGGFSASPLGALQSGKLEDIDTSPVHPTKFVLAEEQKGVFSFALNLDFDDGKFTASKSSFTVTRIIAPSRTYIGHGVFQGGDNVDWTHRTLLGGVSYPDGLLFVNEDTKAGEIWQVLPNGDDGVRVGKTTVEGESTGILDVSVFLGFRPGSTLVCNNFGNRTSSMALLIHPHAAESNCGNSVCDDEETISSCRRDCPVGPPRQPPPTPMPAPLPDLGLVKLMDQPSGIIVSGTSRIVEDFEIILQTDGRIVILYSPSGSEVWRSNKSGSVGNYFLTFQRDCHWLVYSGVFGQPAISPFWVTGVSIKNEACFQGISRYAKEIATYRGTIDTADGISYWKQTVSLPDPPASTPSPMHLSPPESPSVLPIIDHSDKKVDIANVTASRRNDLKSLFLKKNSTSRGNRGN